MILKRDKGAMYRVNLPSFKVLEKILFCFSIFLLSLYAPFLALGETTAQKGLFMKAQATFNRAQRADGEEKRMIMLKAASLFETLIEEYSIENGHLYYNLGNAYYQAGEKGKAILNYRRAQRLISGNSDLDHNLRMAKKDLNLPGSNGSWWRDIVQSVLFWHYLLDYSTRRMVLISSFISIWLILSFSVFFKNLLTRTMLVVTIVVTLATGGSFLLSTYQLYMVSSGVVIGKNTSVRKGPGSSYELFYQENLPEGTEFQVVESQGDWWKIKLPNDDEVWVKAESAELI